MWAIPRAIYPLRTPIAAQSKKIWLTWERTDGQLICSMIRAPHLTNTAHYILPQTGKDILLPLSARGMSMLPYWLIHYIIEQDPKMEVLHHIRSYFAGIFPYVGLIYALYMVGTSNLGSWHGHWMCIYISFFRYGIPTDPDYRLLKLPLLESDHPIWMVDLGINPL